MNNCAEFHFKILSLQKKNFKESAMTLRRFSSSSRSPFLFLLVQEQVEEEFSLSVTNPVKSFDCCGESLEQYFEMILSASTKNGILLYV